MRRSHAPLGLAAGVLCLLLVAACSAFAWPHDSPLAARRGGAEIGAHKWAWLYLLCLAAAFTAYVAGLALLRGGARFTTVAVLAVAIQLAPLGAPLLLSTDAWTYWDYGRISVRHGTNPYEHAPSSFPGDPAYPWVGGNWKRTTSVYGPGFTLASEPVALAAGSSHAAAAWIYKALAAIASLAAAFLAASLSKRPAFALAFVGWNPLLAVHFAGGGHNDAWMATLVLAALALSAAGRRTLAGVVWALAVSIKWVPLVLLPLRALEARGTGRRVDHVGFAATAALVAGLATWRYGHSWLEALAPIARNANHETRMALPHRVQGLGLPHGLSILLFGLAFAAAYAVLARSALRGRARLGLTAGLLLLATPYLTAWYTIWAVPLAAAEDDAAAQVLALALCAYLLKQTVPL